MEGSVLDTNINTANEPLSKMEYTSNGRMKYNPEYFGNTGSPWQYEDYQYVIGWYDIIGPEEMAFALERTPDSIMEKVRKLRIAGEMIRPVKLKYKKRAFAKSP